MNRCTAVAVVSSSALVLLIAVNVIEWWVNGYLSDRHRTGLVHHSELFGTIDKESARIYSTDNSVLMDFGKPNGTALYESDEGTEFNILKYEYNDQLATFYFRDSDTFGIHVSGWHLNTRDEWLLLDRAVYLEFLDTMGPVPSDSGG